jgi:hypothetical protein
MAEVEPGPGAGASEDAMLKAIEVANELRRIADALETDPDLKIEPYFIIDTETNKDAFIALAKIMPKPMTKGIDFEGTTYEDFKLKHSFWCIKILRSAYCRILEPAKPAVYDCPSILSEEEESTLTSGA